MLTSLGQAGQCGTRPPPVAPSCARQRCAPAKAKVSVYGRVLSSLVASDPSCSEQGLIVGASG